ncbi:thiamine phosphate synthase [Pseudobythopirellula maris]|nr:thiamine phosphate synthase [Pseudobythopirellula maris]
MSDHSPTNPDSVGALRAIDASLNRAAEGLRVVEDYARFVLDDGLLTAFAKRLRHELADASSGLPGDSLVKARETQRDVGASISTEAEGQRGDAWMVALASLKRVQQSLRSLEEYSKIGGADVAGRFETLRYESYTLEKALAATRSAIERFDGVRLYVLVGACGDAREFESLVVALMAGGAQALQLRDKQADDRTLLARARALVALTRQAGVLAIVNDRPDLATLARADGVHVGQTELGVKEARTIVGPNALVGVSTHTIEQARAAVLDGADYIGCGPTFPSQTKSFDAFAGLAFLEQVAAEVRLPAFAIGGVDAANLPQVLQTGCSRVAVSAAVAQAADPGAAAKLLAKALTPDNAAAAS